MHTDTPAGTAAPASPSTPAEPTAPPGVVGQPAARRFVEGSSGQWAYAGSDGPRVALFHHWPSGYACMKLLPQDARALAAQLVDYADLADRGQQS